MKRRDLLVTVTPTTLTLEESAARLARVAAILFEVANRPDPQVQGEDQPQKIKPSSNAMDDGPQ